ncbi:MAG: hypothetical protein VR72_15115 [Clostridiaceae bacterium BRH_c20a]|nr:MAG: hypothetical protein VR72_15115 [Clostridiaceae bacterium BRH_c20a]
MYLELENLKIEIEKNVKRTNELEVEKHKLIADGVRVQQELFQSLVDDCSIKEQRALQKELDATERDLKLTEDKIELVKEKKQKELRILLNDAKIGMDRELKFEREKLDDMVKDLRKLKAEYLMFVLLLHSRVVKIQDIRRGFLAASHKINCRDFDRGYFSLIPEINLTSTHSGIDKPVGILEREFVEAYKFGRVQPWVKLYIQTGIILESNEEANKKLSELAEKKEGDK